MKSAIASHATPWEVEKALRAEAQVQASALHRCFDVLPISCQRSGYVGVGVSLSREGEIRSHWIARSTYGAECPVEQCMSEVVANWFFEPIPKSIRVVLPVQVLPAAQVTSQCPSGHSNEQLLPGPHLCSEASISWGATGAGLL